MAERITNKQLEALCERINKITGNETTPYTKTEDGLKANIGNYHLSGAYGGVSLHQMATNSGGVHDVFRCGHVPKRELYEKMWAFICGLEEGKNLK